VAGEWGVWPRRGDPERSAASRVDPEAFEGVGEVGRSGEESVGGTVDGRLAWVGVRAMSGVVGVEGMVCSDEQNYGCQVTWSNISSRRGMLYRRSCSLLTKSGFPSRFYSKKARKADPTFVEVLKPLESLTRRLFDSSTAGC
jgi:hypothetical protein